MRNLPPTRPEIADWFDVPRHVVDLDTQPPRLTRRGQVMSIWAAVLVTIAFAVAAVAIANAAGSHPETTFRLMLALLVTGGMALIVVPTRHEVRIWRARRGRGRAEELAHDVAHYLEADLVPMVATAVEEREIGWAARPPSLAPSADELADVAERMCHWVASEHGARRTASSHENYHFGFSCPYRSVAEVLRGHPDPRQGVELMPWSSPLRADVAQDLNDGYRS